MSRNISSVGTGAHWRNVNHSTDILNFSNISPPTETLNLNRVISSNHIPIYNRQLHQPRLGFSDIFLVEVYLLNCNYEADQFQGPVDCDSVSYKYYILSPSGQYIFLYILCLNAFHIDARAIYSIQNVDKLKLVIIFS